MRTRFTHAIHDHYIEVLPKPAWPNLCGHKRSEYVGTVKTWPNGLGEPMKPIDVYVHAGDLKDTASVCIRYGPEGAQYCSPGSVLDFLASAARNDKISFYKEVAALLVKRMDFSCEIKKERK